MRRALLEAVLVAAIGAALAFAANALSPRGLRLSKDYFPGTQPALPAPGKVAQPENPSGTRTNSPAELLAAKLRQNGLQLADSELATKLFYDPRRDQDAVIFIDARDDQHYKAGHIPGAYQFDRFDPVAYLTNVVQVCLTAQQIVFYCGGGDCEDSEHAAITLRDSIGIPKEKVFVYGGGMTEWAAKGLPVELGVRNSGQLTNMAPAASSSALGGTNR